MSECIADINLAMRPKLAVVDAIRAMEGIGPGRAMSKIRRLGLVITGYDPVAVDATCCRLAGVEPREVKHVILAARHGLGVTKNGEIEVTGIPFEQARPKDFKLPPMDASAISPVRGIEVLLGKPCSNCISALATALMMLKDEGFELPERSLQIVMGANPSFEERAAEGRLFLGRCLKDMGATGERVGGCPPAASFVVEAVKKFERLHKARI
jgi:hypothetical protein